jgi:hypothetical protein
VENSGGYILKVVGCDRYIVLKLDLQGYRVIGEARPHWLAGEPELLKTTKKSLKRISGIRKLSILFSRYDS